MEKSGKTKFEDMLFTLDMALLNKENYRQLLLFDLLDQLRKGMWDFSLNLFDN